MPFGNISNRLLLNVLRLASKEDLEYWSENKIEDSRKQVLCSTEQKMTIASPF